MDKNLAAVLRDDTFTVVVNFQGYDNPYTYVAMDRSIKVGDFVVVPHVDRSKTERLSVASVVEVHDDLQIEPDSEIVYKWVMQKVDDKAYKDMLEGNKLIEEAARKAYQTHAKRSYRQQILAGMDEDAQKALRAVIDGSNTLLANSGKTQG